MRTPVSNVGAIEEKDARLRSTKTMASILEFRQPVCAVRRANGQHPAVGPADIVLFPGVRYERWGEASAEPAKPGRRPGRYDRIDLGDDH